MSLFALLPLLTALFMDTGATVETGGTGAPRFFGYYTGTATVTTSQFYPAGTYDAEVAIAQTASGVVGLVNIVFDPEDWLGGTITHTFAGRIQGAASQLTLRYSDRMCGADAPLGKCYPHALGERFVQVSFIGEVSFEGDVAFFAKPTILPGVPYSATLPFDSVMAMRVQSEPRTSFDGHYSNLRTIWPGTVLLPLPLPLFGTNQLFIRNGQIRAWFVLGRFPLPLSYLFGCFDDARGRGWMNQQGFWFYDWVLDPLGEGLSVIVTGASLGVPECDALGDPLAGEGLDYVHRNLVGLMFELSNAPPYRFAPR